MIGCENRHQQYTQHIVALMAGQCLPWGWAIFEGDIWFARVISFSSMDIALGDFASGRKVNMTYDALGLQISKHLSHFEEPMDLVYNYH